MEQRRICPYCMQKLEAGEEQCPHCGRELAGRNPSGSLPAGTVLFVTGNGTLYFHSSNAQVDALPTETAPNPLVGDTAYTLGDSDESL